MLKSDSAIDQAYDSSEKQGARQMLAEWQAPQVKGAGRARAMRPSKKVSLYNHT